MEENQNKEKRPKSNKLFIAGAVILIVLMLVISISEIISINSMNRKIKQQQRDITQLNNELNYYKNKSNDNGEFFEGSQTNDNYNNG